ncbi:5895_t:CDS:2 [Paraglomus brasilianum]|uniref:5895_t:CDS:1 n=1 Tax=Paraglomus brasilianum TaxID=144538 RepID=A0A9N9AXX5_9GLOM|nr:5895_t:CDS:2 [Paraglomus brasilianum]
MKYMDQKSNGAGMEYYENLCMRAVNQSIGKNFEKTLKVLNLFDIQKLHKKKHPGGLEMGLSRVNLLVNVSVK